MRIEQLPAVVANQIAAGEVIERPASVIKELLENALDAGADNISIDIGFGGLNQLKISDNGSGIVADDLPLAVAAHATSKIRQLNDLYAITSMGFRGEALASIASVSRLTLSSRPSLQEHAMMLHVEGSTTTLSPCARSQGTTVDVRDLFFNAPVRKKFLKTPRSEYQAIEGVVKRFALSAPSIALTLRHNDKLVFELPAATCEKTRLARIKKLLGKTFVEQAVFLDVEQGGMRLVGWVSGEDYQRSQNDKQWVYLNQRMVKDKLINHAIKQAYEGLLHPGRYPACLLYLTIAAGEVDVNVHPTKHEVRFQQPRLMHDFISTHLSQALASLKPQHQTDNYTALASSIGKDEREDRIRETYIRQPLRAAVSASTGEFSTNTCHVLNARFALIFLQKKPYLVDIERAEQQRFRTILEEQPLPLASRPLLVPISYTIDRADRQVIEQSQLQLAQLGIGIDWVGENTVVVRSIPQLFPQLDIKQLLQRLGEVGPDFREQKNLLITCQSFDAHQLLDEEKALLVDYLQQQAQISNPLKPWGLLLDTEKCRDLLYA